MQNKRKSVRHTVALQFAGMRVFALGMVLFMLVAILAIVAQMMLPGAKYGTLLLFTAFGLFLLNLLATWLAYAAARRNPRIARKEIARFVETHQDIPGIYESGAADLLSKQASLEQEWHEIFTKAWDKGVTSQRQSVIAYLRQVLADLSEVESQMSREDKLRNQSFLIETYALQRKIEVQLQELEAMSVPDLPEEVLDEMRRTTQPALERAHASLQHSIDLLLGEARAAREMLAEAQQLL